MVPVAINKRIVGCIALLLTIPTMAAAANPLTTTFSSPAYTFAASCDLSQPLAFINALVANLGTTESAPTAILAVDAAGILAGERITLPTLAPHSSATVRIPLRYVPSSSGSIGGTHAMTVEIGLQRERPLMVVVPNAFCVTPSRALGGAAVLTGPLATNSQRSHIEVAATAAPVVRPFPRSPVDTARIAIDRSLRPPVNLRVATGAADCAQHVGAIAGSLVCPDMIRSGNMLIVWDWHPGPGPAQIDGFRIYRVDGQKRLVDTRPTKSDITLSDIAVPPGGYPGTCYAVSAFAGATESEPSNTLCPTRQQTTIGATPSVRAPAPKPTAPSHVVIHITEDSFPMDTVVAVGGDVTWINDDTDPHTVWDGTNQAYLGANGGRYTLTFRTFGTVNYTCQIHPGMAGKITIVVNP